MGQNLDYVTSNFIVFFYFSPRKNCLKGQQFVIEREGERKYKVRAFFFFFALLKIFKSYLSFPWLKIICSSKRIIFVVLVILNSILEIMAKLNNPKASICLILWILRILSSLLGIFNLWHYFLLLQYAEGMKE